MTEGLRQSSRVKADRQAKRKDISPPRKPAPRPKREPSPIKEPSPEVTSPSLDLPTAKEPQSGNLPPATHLNISESGILLKAVEKSRQKWLMDGLFETYWIKPTKKKLTTDFQNPPKESMVKLGSCSMTIEPHVFDINLYSVKNSQLTFLPPVETRPFPTTTHVVHREFHSGTPVQSNYTRPSTEVIHSHTPRYTPGSGNFGSPAVPRPTPAPVHATTPKPTEPRQAEQSGTANQTNETPRKPTASETPVNADPVIQMLAARAASDHSLKALMKIVALGHASPEQLNIFQRHIDELNAIIRAQKQPSSGDNTSKPTEATPQPKPPAPAPIVSRPPVTIPVQHSTSTSYSTSPFSQPPQVYRQPVPFIKSKTITAGRPDLTAIVFDFNGLPQVRYLIPRNSIIEYIHGGTQVLVSFLVTRKGVFATGGGYENEKEYYQPVTVRLSSSSPRVLEPLSRVVAHPDEVRKHMEDVMNKMQRAHDVNLILQLPREGIELELEDVNLKAERDAALKQTSFEAPNSLLPLYSTAMEF